MNTNDHRDEEPPAPASPQRRRTSLGAKVFGAAVGLASVAALLLAVSIVRRGPATPVITRDDVEAARRRWEERGPASYDMDITIGGRQPGVVHIEVRDGKVTAMTRDGVAPSQERTWDYWTVPEQFETIEQDFDSAATPGGFGAAQGTQTIFKADFDPQLGYPRRYERFVLGTNLDVDWTVTRFEAVR